MKCSRLLLKYFDCRFETKSAFLFLSFLKLTGKLQSY